MQPKTVGQSDTALFHNDPWYRFAQLVTSGNRDQIKKLLETEGWRFCHLAYVTHPSHQWTLQMPYLLLRAYVGREIFTQPAFLTTLISAGVNSRTLQSLDGTVPEVVEYVFGTYDKPTAKQFYQDCVHGDVCQSSWRDQGLLP